MVLVDVCCVSLMQHALASVAAMCRSSRSLMEDGTVATMSGGGGHSLVLLLVLELAHLAQAALQQGVQGPNIQGCGTLMHPPHAAGMARPLQQPGPCSVSTAPLQVEL